MSGTICWYCDNCCGKCSWSKNFTPVDGWEAKKTKVAKRIDSYIVDECPKFVLSYSKILTSKELAALLNITNRTLCRIGKRDFYSLCKNAGKECYLHSSMILSKSSTLKSIFFQKFLKKFKKSVDILPP